MDKTRLWSISLAAAIGIACAPTNQDREQVKEQETETPVQGFALKLPRWAQRDANVRAEPSASSSVMTRLSRGERVEVSGTVDGWVEVFRDGQAIGFIAQTELRSSPLPEKEFQMRDVSFRVSDEGDDAWTYVWTLDLENTGLTAYTSLAAELKFVDGHSRLIATDIASGISLNAGQRKSFSGTLIVPLPPGSSIRNVGAEIRESGD